MSASSRGMYWTAGRLASLSVSARLVLATTRPLKRTRTRFGLGSIVILGRSILVSSAEAASRGSANETYIVAGREAPSQLLQGDRHASRLHSHNRCVGPACPAPWRSSMV